MAADDRERIFEQALKQHLQRDAAGADAGACLEAETLAAYQEKTLVAAEMDLVAAHLKECARCQEIFSHLDAKELPVESRELDTAQVPDTVLETKIRTRRVTEIPRKKMRVGWMIPVGALAAGLLLLVGLRDFRAGRPDKTASEPVQVAENRREDRVERDYSSNAPEPLEKQKSATDSDKELKDEKREGQTDALRDKEDLSMPRSTIAAAPSKGPSLKKVPPNAPPPPVPKVSSSSGFDEPSRLQDSGAAIAERSNDAAAQSAKKESARPSPPNAQMDAVENKQSAADRQAQAKTQGAVAGNIGAVSESVEVTAAPPAATETVTVTGEAKSKYSNSPLQGGNALQMLALQPGSSSAQFGKSIWKFGEHGSIVHSSDGGKSWKSQAAAVAVTLTSGSAPSKNVCWIAGAAGTLLRTTDGGRHWQMVITPIARNLGGVVAMDKQHATIWDDTSRLRFETADGGATWKPVNAP
jgi:hypothetical protein